MLQLTNDQKIEVLKLATQLSLGQLATRISEESDKVLNFSNSVDENFKMMCELITKNTSTPN